MQEASELRVAKSTVKRMDEHEQMRNSLMAGNSFDPSLNTTPMFSIL